MDVVRDRVIHLGVGELALFVSGITELLNVVKSQAEFPFSAFLQGAKTALTIIKASASELSR